MQTFGLQDQQFKIVANIPYYISGLLFRQCLECDIQPNTLVFLVQKEVAQRIAREPKESILSLSVKIYGDPVYVDTIKRGHFTPPPAVDSAIIAVHNINRSRLNGISDETFFTVLQASFGQKRKQLAGNLAHLYQKEVVAQTLSKIGKEPKSRAEDLSVTDFVGLITHLQQK
jgi:16S rRNA (adenine1518-N6/adenine1519-N6)-dimethyltransferase